MFPFSSYRGKLQAAFVALGLAAIAATGWEASSGAAAAMRRATYDRLDAIRATRARQIARYFDDVNKHVLALSSDESTVAALEELRAAWVELPETAPGSERFQRLRLHYEEEFKSRASGAGETALVDRWFPADGRARTLQYFYIAGNPHPVRSKDLLLSAPEAGRYGRAHARYHPTLHRYQSAFGFYDIFLIEARRGRILYTVFKEVDLGMALDEPPYQETSLARVFRRAMSLSSPEEVVTEDYRPYAASYFAPAAFVAAPVWRAGLKIGVLAIQLSVDEINRVMIGGGPASEIGLGETGHAYVVGADGRLRSDLRLEVEHPEQYYAQLSNAGMTDAEVERIRRYGTGILNVRLSESAAAGILQKAPGTEEGLDYRGIRVLRSHSRLDFPDFEWTVVAEIEAGEAYAPVEALQLRILGIGLIVAVVFLAAAGFLAGSVTRPVLALAASARKLGGGEFGTRVGVETGDEIGQLAASFNRMAEDLERTTVSKKELEALAGRLITAQEQERSRIARELHDDVTQRLAAAAIEAGRLGRKADADPNQWREGLERIKQQLARLSDDIHGLSWRLHPATLEDLGLVAAIESECRGFFERGGPPVDFRSGNEEFDAPREATLALFRILQEGLRNIQRHADAGEVAIRLGRDGKNATLEIRDNGKGFDRNDPGWRAGLGLASMEERAKLLGGRVEIRSRPGQGTEVAAVIPLEDGNEEAEDSAGG